MPPFLNAFGACIPVPSKLNLPLWKSALDNYSDRIVADFLVFGWPINYRSDAFPAPSSSNHSSADRFPDATDSFLLTEIEHAAMAGPFTYNPFPTPLQTSPLQTVPKDGIKRHVVLDPRGSPGQVIPHFSTSPPLA